MKMHFVSMDGNSNNLIINCGDGLILMPQFLYGYVLRGLHAKIMIVEMRC